MNILGRQSIKLDKQKLSSFSFVVTFLALTKICYFDISNLFKKNIIWCLIVFQFGLEQMLFLIFVYFDKQKYMFLFSSGCEMIFFFLNLSPGQWMNRPGSWASWGKRLGFYILYYDTLKHMWSYWSYWFDIKDYVDVHLYACCSCRKYQQQHKTQEQQNMLTSRTQSAERMTWCMDVVRRLVSWCLVGPWLDLPAMGHCRLARVDGAVTVEEFASSGSLVHSPI